MSETAMAAGDPTARAQMWSARHNALMASLALAPGSKAVTTYLERAGLTVVAESLAGTERLMWALGDLLPAAFGPGVLSA